MLVNVFVPHVAATVALRRHAPGTATALLLGLPIYTLLIGAAEQERSITWARFAWSGPLMALALLALIPLLFRSGKAI